MDGTNIRTVYPSKDSVIAELFSIAYSLRRYTMDHSLKPRPDMLMGRQVIDREITQIAVMVMRGMLMLRESETI